MNLARIENEQLAGLTLEAILEEINTQTDFPAGMMGFKIGLSRARARLKSQPVATQTVPTVGGAVQSPALAQPYVAPAKQFDYKPAKDLNDMSHIFGNKKAGKK